jgi:hypothetical protein
MAAFEVQRPPVSVIAKSGLAAPRNDGKGSVRF